MKKNYINIGLMLLSLVVVGTACKRSLPVPGNSAVSSMANNWWVTGYQPSHGYWQDGKTDGEYHGGGFQQVGHTFRHGGLSFSEQISKLVNLIGESCH